VRAQRLLPSVIAISFLASTHLASQAPQTRAGFWLAGGIGVGGFAWQCDGCSHERHDALSWSLRLGWTPTKSLLLGFEGIGSSLAVGGASIRPGYMALTAYWYPNTSGLFLKGGLGDGFHFRKTTTARLERDGGALVLGTGYDVRVGRKISITPMLSLWRSARANLRTDSSIIETGFRSSGAALDVGVTFHSLLGAKNPPIDRPQIRRGFWLGFGYGGGTIAWQCDGCSNQNHGAGSFVLRLGGTVSKKVLLGVELIGSSPRAAGPLETFGPDSQFQGVTATYTAFTAYWYPDADGGLFLKSGVGTSSYRQQTGSSTAASHAGVIQVGAGYDIRVGEMASLTPMLSLWASSKGDLKDGSTTVATGLRHNGATFQLGVTFH